MKLISPNFLKEINDEWHRCKVLNELFKDEEVISIVMVKKKLTFDKACDWVAMLCNETEAPEASESEKVVMQRVAKEFLDEWKKINNG